MIPTGPKVAHISDGLDALNVLSLGPRIYAKVNANYFGYHSYPSIGRSGERLGQVIFGTIENETCVLLSVLYTECRSAWPRSSNCGDILGYISIMLNRLPSGQPPEKVAL